ncbi:helix-turn-helix domain-containing protein [Chitinimonas koreensis]|uniref:helix-turn-helix domain-containing protein n=1 Tax=Chitinimonas koreensis TaxID=356302 RepID=UPI0006891A70|nr:helix-turn-helix transcriptional regulator [Chitinimonas koreensis]QNM98483.1 helix-turn-helix transcriptional regulator [Chitinimonas koreensis]
MVRKAREGFLSEEANAMLRTLGEHIRLARKRRRWTRPELASRTGVSVPTLARLESGSANIGMHQLMAVLTAFGLVADVAALANPATDAEGARLEALARGRAAAGVAAQPPIDTDF